MRAKCRCLAGEKREEKMIEREFKLLLNANALKHFITHSWAFVSQSSCNHILQVTIQSGAMKESKP